MAVFTWVPVYGASRTIAPRVRTVNFGDGYEQRVGDGINLLKHSWSLTFRGQPSTIDAIDAFLTARAGIESFTWSPKGANPAQYICKSWVAVEDSFNVKSLTATFERVFEN